MTAYGTRLAASLHGPSRARARLVTEIEDGLAETIAAHTRPGVPAEVALDKALREFGTVEDLLPSCQRELTALQGLRTAWTLVVAGGGLAAFAAPARDVLPAAIAGTLLVLAALVVVAGAAGLAVLRVPWPSSVRELLVRALAFRGALLRGHSVHGPSVRGGSVRGGSVRDTARDGGGHGIRLVARCGTAAAALLALAVPASLVTAIAAGSEALVAGTAAGALTAAAHAVVAGAARTCRRCVTAAG